MKKYLIILLTFAFLSCDILLDTSTTDTGDDNTIDISTSSYGQEASYTNGYSLSTFVIICPELTDYANVAFYYTTTDKVPKNGTYNIVSNYEMSSETEASFTSWVVGDDSFDADSGTLTISNANTTTNSYDIEIDATGSKWVKDEDEVWNKVENLIITFTGKATIAHN